MKTSDLIVGIATFIAGSTIYLTSYKTDKKKARIGFILMLLGSIIALGRWMINLVMSGQ
jgi:uncharacterized membrane protein YjjP (DUF1212 family)